MPIINGLKMACEPCIRGHRSTKCTHAKERLMVPVRKPGRPLSVCPHPPGVQCACGGITAAIPRAQKCGCGPSVPTPEPAPPEPPAPKGSVSPTRRTFQIQKPATKSAGRKQSFDLATLERMDPESYNIHSAPPLYRTTILPRISSASDGESVLSPTTPGHSLDYLAAMPGTLDRPAVAAGLANGADYPLPRRLNGHLPMPSPAMKPETPRSVVGGVANGSYFDDFGTSPGRAESSVAATSDGAITSKPGTPAAAPKSCCAGKPSSPRTKGDGNPKPPPTAAAAAHQSLGHYGPHVSATNGSGLANGTGSLSHQMGVAGSPMMGPFPPPAMHPIFFTHAADPTMYIYPPYYGTYQHPIQPPQWRQPMPPPGGLGYGFHGGHAHAHAHAHPHMNMGAPPAPTMGLGASDDAVGGGGFESMSHQCTCGDTCNCLGCPAHPYNEVTQDYVRSAMNSMTDEPGRGEARGDKGARNGRTTAPLSAAPARAGGGGCCGGGGSGGDGHTPTTDAEEALPAAAAEAQQSAGGAGAPAEPAASSPPQAQTPSEASAASEDQTHLSASDFLFVTYPFGCEGETASCQCGDDCQCVGCLIHNHPYADG